MGDYKLCDHTHQSTLLGDLIMKRESIGKLGANLLCPISNTLICLAALAMGCVSLNASAEFCRDDKAGGGSASCYLTGTYELRESARTWLQIVNPTAHPMWVTALFFDDNEKPLMCVQQEMSPNDLWEISVHENKQLEKPGFGVVKVVSHWDGPVVGVIGNQRIAFSKLHGPGVSETGLHPIQPAIFQADYEKFILPYMDKFGCKKH